MQLWGSDAMQFDGFQHFVGSYCLHFQGSSFSSLKKEVKDSSSTLLSIF
jgi:hypothetical protein